MVSGRTMQPPHPLLDERFQGIRVRDNSRPLPLPRLTYQLLYHLAQAPPDEIVPYPKLAACLWPDETVVAGDDRFRYHANIIRGVAELGGWPRKILIARWGVGLHLDYSFGYVPPGTIVLPSERPTKTKRSPHELKTNS